MHINNTNPILVEGSPERAASKRRLGGRLGRHGDRAVKLLTPDELEAALRDIGARRYHRLHPFHQLLHGGQCTKGQVQAWALNRYYYQAMIPIKDASLIARCEDPRSAANGARAWSTTTARARTTAASRAGCGLTDGLGLDREYVTSLRGLAAGDALCRRCLCPFRAREDAARSDRLVADGTVLAADHQRADRGHAGELSDSSPARRWPISTSGRRRPHATPISRSTIASGTPARRSSSSRCWPRSNSNAACCGRCSTRCITPMSIPKKYRPALSCRAVDGFCAKRARGYFACLLTSRTIGHHSFCSLSMNSPVCAGVRSRE